MTGGARDDVGLKGREDEKNLVIEDFPLPSSLLPPSESGNLLDKAHQR